MWRRKKEEEEGKKEAAKPVVKGETYEEEKGGIVLKEGKTEGLTALIQVSEEVQVEQDHELNVKSIGFNGNLKIINPSKVDRLWDIDLTLKNIEGTDLESNVIKIKELGTSDEDNTDSREFKITGEAKNLLLVKEYINTLPDADDILTIKDIESNLLRLKDKGIGAEPKSIEGKKEISKEEPEEKYGEDMTEEKGIEEEKVIDYETMTVGELKEYCETHNIDIPPNTRKAEIIEIIKRSEQYDIDEDITDAGVEAESYNLESFGISIYKLNTIYFGIALRSLFEKPLNKLEIIKNLSEDFNNIKIVDCSEGVAEIENKRIKWTIEELDPDTTVLLKLTADIQVDTKDPVKTGKIEITYKAESSFTGGLEIEKFNAYTNNKHFVDMIEKDEAPGIWDCKLLFENPSEFFIELFNADVYAPVEPNTKFVKIEESDAPILPGGAKWYSAPWQYEYEDYPTFRKDIQFRVMADIKAEVNASIVLDEVELVIASITGKVSYEVPGVPISKVVKEKISEEKAKVGEAAALEEEVEVEEKGEILEIRIPSYRETEILAMLTLTNDGSAPLNEVRFTQKRFSDVFRPPNPKDPEKPDKIKLLWDGKEVDVDPDSISIDKDSVQISLKNLKESPMGMFEANSTMEVQYPIHAESPPKDTEFDTDVIYNANTYPIGQELEFIPLPEEVPLIKVLHIRRKYRLEKQVIPFGDLGTYQIVLRYENLGENLLNDFIIIDKVPDNFEYSEFSTEPEITDEQGTDTLKWTIEKLEMNDKLEISYKIKGKGEYHPSDAQLTF